MDIRIFAMKLDRHQCAYSQARRQRPFRNLFALFLAHQQPPCRRISLWKL
ncbi:hypothetical protein [Rubritalea tangerina]